MTRRTRLLEERGRGHPATTSAPSSACPPPSAADTDVVALEHPDARCVERTGAKAAALAVALARGLPVLPGFVLATGSPPLDLRAGDRGAIGSGAVDVRAGDPGAVEPLAPVRAAWERLSEGGARPLAVRSSSTQEDGATSSMAGIFTSVLDVVGWPAFLRAVGAVRASAGGAPMAVLVQRMVEARCGGVLFGVDPVSGRTDRLVVAVVDGGPVELVGGRTTGVRHVLTPRGRVLEVDRHAGGPRLRASQRRALAALASATAATFGGPQDVEWGFGPEGRLWLLQSRPVTAIGTTATATGPVLGPGPVAETLPGRLGALEVDLWVEPLRGGVEDALVALGVTPRRRLAASPIVTVVGGRIAADLDLLDPGTTPRRRLARLDPRPPARRLGAAWRVGRLRRALPLLAGRLVDEVDAELRSVPPLASLADGHLVALLGRAPLLLRSVHGHEVLAGAIGSPVGVTASSVALRHLAAARSAGLDDAGAVAAHPTILALVPPSIGPVPALPDAPAGPLPVTVGALGPREALRLRARWLHELTARAAWELGVRLQRDGRLADVALVRELRHDELLAVVVDGVPVPADLAGRAADAGGPPLPAAFRLTAGGDVVAEPWAHRGGGRGAGGGRGGGTVHDPATGPPPPGAVLVVRTLDPALAAVLPGLGGIVAETGSTLSHLAILARELGVPTAVGVADAVERHPPGTVLVVDGTTGEVTAS